MDVGLSCSTDAFDYDDDDGGEEENNTSSWSANDVLCFLCNSWSKHKEEEKKRLVNQLESETQSLSSEVDVDRKQVEAEIAHLVIKRQQYVDAGDRDGAR